ncbi:MAG: hypothetical protein E7486_07385, partial [Ruminococcaceae bacterium]|nr:hypothetical protein [Oscillospiraceae bacterium]
SVLNLSVNAGWMTLAVLVLRAVLMKSPKWIRVLLWGLVGLRLLFPFQIESVLSLLPSAEAVPPQILYDQTPTVHTGIGFLNSTINPILSQGMTPGPGDSVNPMQVATFVAANLWVLGMAGMLLSAAVSYLRLRRKVREAVPAEKNIRICDGIVTPFILGIFFPKIYLPSHLEGADRNYVIAHEEAHLSRKDHWWKPLGFLLLTVHWFNPLLWVAYSLLCRDIELACDERVIRTLGTECKKPYSLALVNCSVSRRSIAACPLAFGETGVKGRVKAILHYQKPAVWIILAGVVGCVVAAVCFFTVPKGEAPSSGGTSRAELNLLPAELVFECGLYSFSQPAEDAPFYRVVNGTELFVLPREGDARVVGTLTPISLTPEAFDSATGPEGINFWADGFSAEILRQNNRRAWEVKTQQDDLKEWILLLEQQDGSYFVCYGYWGENGSHIRWIYAMERGAISSGSSQATVGGVTPPGKLYVFQSSVEPVLKPSLLLNEKEKTFQFTFSAFSSYIPRGSYIEKGDRLILTAEDGPHTYQFRKEGNALIFDEAASSPIPKYRYSGEDKEARSPVPDGAVFGYSGMTDSDGRVFSPVIDTALFDVDGDGKPEQVTLSSGPTSGLFTFRVVVQEGEKTECNAVFHPDRFGSLSFSEKDGAVQLQLTEPEGAVHLYDLSLAEGRLSLSQGGIPIETWG